MNRIACLLFSLLAFPSFALTQVDIFQSEIVLTEQENAEELAKAKGFERVLIKASGQQRVANNPVIEKAMKSISPYLSQISFGQQGDQETLKVSFNSKQIQSLLTKAGLPYWSENRNSILVWVVEEDSYERQIIWEQSGSSVTDLLTLFSDARGLPITVPVGDFDDVTGVSAPEIWGGFVEPISQASSRYSADAVLVLRVQRLNTGRASVRWTLFDQEPLQMIGSRQSPITGQKRGELGSTLQMVIDEISDYFASKSAVQVADVSTESVEVQFLNVDSSRNFFRLESIFKSLNSVASTEVLKIQGNDVTFKINLLASVADFQRELDNFKQVRAFSLDAFSEREETLPIVANSPEEPTTSQPNEFKNEEIEKEIDNEGVTVVEGSVEPEKTEEKNVIADESTSFVTEFVEDKTLTEQAVLVYEWLD